ncbi:MAG: efflux RND transporter periplasmic adaptor subunit [Proteobacteria bacterium]|nr:efflux RND transporter periplasmic adaptor subunit [Pseudomonadota bacterium]
MSRTLKFTLPVIFIVVASAVAALLFSLRTAAPKTQVTPPALLVQVQTAQRTPVIFNVKSQGTVMPRTQTTLVAEASGRIIEVSPAFVNGGFFSKGDVLIRIDPREYESAALRAQAAVARATTLMATESARAGYAEDDWERLRESNPRTGQASALALRKPQLQEAIAELQSAEAQLIDAQNDLDQTVIRAPYAGLIQEKIADIGQYVNVGSQLARTFAVDYAEIRLPVTQQDLLFLDLQKLRFGEPFNVTLSARLGGLPLTWAGKIMRSEGVFDTSSRVLYLVGQVEDPYDLNVTGMQPLLLVGTFVEATIVGRDAGELFLVPRYALQHGNTLWIVNEHNEIYPREVTVVRRDADNVYIGDGLEDGERYCVTPINQPLPGMKVRFDG